MIDILLAVLITSLFVNGLTISTGKNMVLEPVKKWLQEKLVYTHVVEQFYEHERSRYDITENRQLMIYKPIIGCVKCMPSLYGSLICLCLFPADVSLIYQIPIVIACSSTVSTIIHQNYI